MNPGLCTLQAGNGSMANLSGYGAETADTAKGSLPIPRQSSTLPGPTSPNRRNSVRISGSLGHRLAHAELSRAPAAPEPVAAEPSFTCEG
jgi:hypothetical protein